MFNFLIYAFFGWYLEVVYQAVEHGKFINRGFLNGPYCPIYGVGVIIVTGVLDPIKGNIIILFAGSVILTSLLELITGFLLEKIFHMHWWDYSNEHFNIGGYICLKFSLLWGVACLVTVRLIHPAVESFVASVPHRLGVVMLSVVMIGFASDFIVTVTAIVHIKQRIALLNDISAQMRLISDKTGEKLFNAVESAKAHKEEFDEKTAASRQKFDELREKYRVQSEKLEANLKRIQNAFPKLRQISNINFREQLNSLRKEISQKNK